MTRPSQKRNNIIRQFCTEHIRKHQPELYKEFHARALEICPMGVAGRPAGEITNKSLPLASSATHEARYDIATNMAIRAVNKPAKHKAIFSGPLSLKLLEEAYQAAIDGYNEPRALAGNKNTLDRIDKLISERGLLSGKGRFFNAAARYEQDYLLDTELIFITPMPDGSDLTVAIELDS